MNCKRKKQETTGGRHNENQNKAGRSSSRLLKIAKMKKGKIGAFPAVSVPERSIPNYVDLTSRDETAGKNEVARKRSRQ